MERTILTVLCEIHGSSFLCNSPPSKPQAREEKVISPQVPKDHDEQHGWSSAGAASEQEDSYLP